MSAQKIRIRSILDLTARELAVHDQVVFIDSADANAIVYDNTFNAEGIISTDEDGQAPFSVSCVEDSILIVGDLAGEQDEYDQYPELADITRNMMEESMGKMQEAYAAFIRLTSEERVKRMMDDESDLFNRVPKHQIASYLGITPESLSRITRRLERSHLKAVD